MAVIVIVALAAIVWWWQLSGSPATTGGSAAPAPAPASGDTTAAINEQLQGIDFGDLDQEFQTIDQDLNSL